MMSDPDLKYNSLESVWEQIPMEHQNLAPVQLVELFWYSVFVIYYWSWILHVSRKEL